LDEVKGKKVTRITGRVFNEKGNPMGGGKVYCDGFETLTLFDGSFTFDDVERGLHVLRVDFQGYENQIRNVIVKEGEESTVNFDLELEVGKTKIFGYILDEGTGEPLRKSGTVFMDFFTKIRSVPIDPETGFYEFKDVSSGVYKIWTSILDFEGELKNVEVREEEEIRIDFQVSEEEKKEVPWG
jgi:hypothetical protein